MAFFNSLGLLVALFCAPVVLGYPQPILARSQNYTSTAVTWYQGQLEMSSSSCGPEAVSTGILVLNKCTTLHTVGLGISQIQDKECSFKLWTSTSDCSGDVWTEKDVPSGNATTCISDGVLDGGEFQHASGIWSCGGV